MTFYQNNIDLFCKVSLNIDTDNYWISSIFRSEINCLIFEKYDMNLLQRVIKPLQNLHSTLNLRYNIELTKILFCWEKKLALNETNIVHGHWHHSDQVLNLAGTDYEIQKSLLNLFRRRAYISCLTDRVLCCYSRRRAILCVHACGC